MAKETFAVHVSGGPFGVPGGTVVPNKGPHTHLRSEGSWLLAVALNMARHGHPTTILKYEWGDTNQYPLPENVTLQKEFSGSYDCLIDIGEPQQAWNDRCKNIDARKYVFGWGGGPNVPCFFADDWDQRWRVARPNLCFKKWYDKLPPNRGIYMPHPVADKQYPANVDSKYMLWGNRGAFCSFNYTQVSEKILEMMERHPDYKYLVLLFSDIRGTHYDKRLPGASPEIIKRFEALPNAILSEPYSGLDHDILIGELKKSKVLLSNGRPGCNPLPLEQVCLGGITLVWEESPFVAAARKYGFFGADIDRLLDSPDLYIEYQHAQAEIAKDHIWDNAYRMFMEELQL